MDWKEKNILVTGADGFIGSWIAKELLNKGANVLTFIRDIKREPAYNLLGIGDRLTLIKGDITDYLSVKRALNEYSINTCFHLAAQAIVTIANTSPLSTFESNIKGTWNVLEACKNSKSVESIVVASSDKAYGVQKSLPYTEDSPLLGLYPYDASKVCADVLARSYFTSFGLPVCVTRNANTYGGADLNFSRIIPDAIRCLINGNQFVIRSDGTPERDYMYIKDAVDGYITLAENMSKSNVKGNVFNFGSGKPISVLELFRKIAAVCGRPNEKPKILSEAKNEIDRQYLSIEKAGKILGWRPKYDLDRGLKETVEWYKDYFGKKMIKT